MEAVIFILSNSQQHTTTQHFIMASTSSDNCCAIRLTWATEYDYGEWNTGTVAYQCDKDATQGKFCGICARNKAPFGKIGASYTWEDGTESTVPEYALKAGKMDDGQAVGKGDALCCVFANPLIDSDGALLAKKKQELLDDEYWRCDKDVYSDDEDCDEDEGSEGEEVSDDEEDSKPVSIDKSVTVADLREMCDGQEIDHEGMSKSEMRSALADITSDEKPKAKSKAKGKAKGKDKSPKKEKKEKQKRAPSQYNLFMKRELPIYKEKHSADHQVAFKACAAMWTAQKDE
jgi:hypothetical protein